MVRDALIRVGLAQAELLVTEALIVQSGPGWNPVMELRLLDADEVDLPRIEATALAVLQGVVHGVSGTDDAVAMLPQQDLIQVRDVAKEGLNRMGAQTIAASRGVGRSAASGTAGRTVCSPAKSLKLQPRANGLEGKLRGFDVDEEALIFHNEAVGRILIRYGKLDVDLVRVTHLCMNKGGCTVVRVHKTLDRRGNGVYAFIKIVSCEESGSLPPPGDSRKIDISTNSTNS